MVRLANGDLIAGGYFTLADAAVARHVARWDGSAWHALGTGLDDFVYALAVLPNGDLLAGGRFQTAGGAPADHLARWDGATWSSFAGGCDGTVLTIAVQPNGDVVVGGTFATAGGTPAASIARWDGNSWSAFGTGLTGSTSLPGTVVAVARLNNGDLVAAGQFTLSLGVLPFLALARWNGAAWSPLANATGGNVTGVAVSLAVLPNGDLLAGGSMNFSSGVPAQGLLRWNGAVAQPVAAPVLSPYAIVVAPNGEVILGGMSLSLPTISFPGVAISNSGISAWTSLPNVPRGIVRAIVPEAAGNILIASEPASGGTVPPFVHRWDGATWTALAAPTPPRVHAMLRAHDGGVFVAGQFASFGGVGANNIVRRQNGAWVSLGAGLDGPVKSMTLAPNGDLIVSGDFAMAGGAPANRIARWNGFAWSTLGAGLSTAADHLTTTIHGEVFAAPGYTLWRFDGAQWTQIVLPLGGSIKALASLPDGDLLVGGRLGGFFPQPEEHSVWRYDAGTITPLPGGLFEVSDMIVTDGGTVTTVGRHGVARWDGSAWTFLATSSTTIYEAPEWVTTLPNGDLLVGGYFPSIGGVAARNVARWDGTAWHALDQIGVNGLTIAGAASADGTVFVAGSLTGAGPHVAWGFAMAEPVCPAAATPFGAGCTGGAGALALQADNRPWAGGTFTSTATGFTTLSLGLHAIGVQPVIAPLPGGSPGCSLFVMPVLTGVLMPTAGTATASLAIPGSVSLAGVTLRTQVVGLELDPSLGLVRVTSTNALDLVVGAY